MSDENTTPTAAELELQEHYARLAQRAAMGREGWAPAGDDHNPEPGGWGA